MNKLLLFTKRIFLGLLATLLSVTSLTAVADTSKSVNFNEVLINTPYNITQEIIVADILPNEGKELITFSVDKQGNRWLIIYQLDSTASEYVIAEQTIIPKAFYRFDLSVLVDKKIRQKQRLYFLSANSLAVYQQNKFKSLVKVKSLYIQEQASFLSRGNFIQNLNNDDFDDVVIADFDKTHVLIGLGMNSFARHILPIKPNVRVLPTGVTYTETTLYFSDANIDKKIDIVLVGDGEMIIYPQYGNSLFARKAIPVAINKTISGTEWWNKRAENGEQLDQSNLEYRKLEQLRDVNNDGLIDMVVRYTKTSGVLNRVNDYEIFLGKQSEGNLIYSPQADSVIQAEGTLTGLTFVDIDGDNRLEVLLAGFDIGLSQIISALITGSIAQDVYVFNMDGQDKFSSKPAIKKDVELTFSLSSGQSGSAVVELADINGDGLQDLVLSDDDELKIYLGQRADENNKTFQKSSVSYSTKLPKDGNLVKVDDLNSDGKDDLLMKFSALDGKDKAKQIKILFAL
ncbi:FG-GAP repeat domain-containing protein [Colwellia ponticola]|uniref:VCBS repeat-containing protein n=1 Tax=Colwellia ponticola TaxID=2304625 RepID=A0A8H2JLI3_9GAMM|nr:VCBS repeat-containing protein [Colwellia ponticola]TMM45775.1 VCBS repeat-containing protein [Colwellia ponticola]